MAQKIVIYYRTTKRTKYLVMGTYSNNGAKHAKMKVIHDFLGNFLKDEKIKLPVHDMNFIAAPINPNEKERWTNLKAERLECKMSMLLTAKFKRQADFLLGKLSEQEAEQ